MKFITIKKFYVLLIAVVGLAVGYFVNYQQVRSNKDYTTRVVNTLFEYDYRGDITLEPEAIELLQLIY